MLDEARWGTLPGLVHTGATFADAAAEFLRCAEHDRTIKPSTLTDYRSIVSAHLLPAFGPLRLEDITTERIERWFSGLASANGSPLSNRTKNKLLVLLNGVFRRAQKASQSGRGCRAAPRAWERRYRRLQRRGGARAGARRGRGARVATKSAGWPWAGRVRVSGPWSTSARSRR